MQKLTNFYEMHIEPTVKHLYITEIFQKKDIDIKENISTNLYKDSLLTLYPLANSEKIETKKEYLEWLTKHLVFKRLESLNSIFDIDYGRGEFSLRDECLERTNEYSVIRRMKLRVFHAYDTLVVAFDPYLKIYNRLSITKLLGKYDFSFEDFTKINRCLVFTEHGGERVWTRGFIKEVYDKSGDVLVKLEIPLISTNRTVDVSSDRVIPFLNKASIEAIVKSNNPVANFNAKMHELGKCTSAQKFETIQQIVRVYVEPLFPVLVRDTQFSINPTPISPTQFRFYQIKPQDEPEYIISRDDIPPIRGKERLSSLSKVKINTPSKEHKIILLATHDTIGILENVVNKLNNGITSNAYHMSLPSKFGIKLSVTDKFVVSKFSDYEQKSEFFLHSAEDKHRDALVLMYLPMRSDLYYRLKAKLAYYGRVSQVISKDKFDIYIAWNLATNIFAKFGYEPWGISKNLTVPNADIVLGLAYSSLKRDGKLRRNIGYVNVFDKDGVWRFMQSASNYIDFDKRLTIFPQMIRSAIIGYMASGEAPKIIDIHYSKKFSSRERKKIFEIVKDLVPVVEEVSFISLDKYHPLRIFDKSHPSMNFVRGGIMQFNDNEFLLSVAGGNGKNAVASRLLRAKIWKEPASFSSDVFPVAYRILAMTKLNWRSAVKETAEPVTMKYAEEIAKLTNYFSLTDWNIVNNQLSRTPWFI